MKNMTVRLFAICGVLAVLIFALHSYDLHFSAAHVIADCADASNASLCYTDRINDVLMHRGLSAALAVLAASYDADPRVASFCHGTTHEIGKAAFKEFKRTGRVELGPTTYYCGYGFYHGFMEQMFAEEGSLSDARAFCAYAGRKVPLPPGYAEGACYHGIGHGVTDGTDPRSWGDATRIAAPGLKLCREVAGSTDEWERRCASGVFNSVALMYRDPKYGLDVGNDPFALCGTAEYTTLERQACYDQMNTLVAYIAKDDFAKILSYTRAITGSQYRTIATLGVAAIYVQEQKLAHRIVPAAVVAHACAALEEPHRTECMKGVVNGIFEFGSPGVEYQEAISLCESGALRPFAHECFGRLIDLARIYYAPATVQKVCANVPQLFLGACTASTTRSL